MCIKIQSNINTPVFPFHSPFPSFFIVNINSFLFYHTVTFLKSSVTYTINFKRGGVIGNGTEPSKCLCYIFLNSEERDYLNYLCEEGFHYL